MIRILIAGRDASSLSAFQSALNKGNTHTTHTESGRQTLSAISEDVFDLLVADEHLGDMTAFELIESVVARQPALNCAMVSSLAPDEFHKASEGLGILMQLSGNPGKNEARQLLEHLKTIPSFIKSSVPEES